MPRGPRVQRAAVSPSLLALGACAGAASGAVGPAASAAALVPSRLDVGPVRQVDAGSDHTYGARAQGAAHRCGVVGLFAQARVRCRGPAGGVLGTGGSEPRATPVTVRY